MGDALQPQGFYHISCQTDLLCLGCSMFVRLLQDLGRKMEGGWSIFSWFMSSSFLSLSHLIERVHLGAFPSIVARLGWGQQSAREVQSWEDRSGLREIAERHGWLTSQSLAEALFISIHSLGVRLTASTLTNNISECIGFLYATVWPTLLCLFLSNLALILISFSYV